MCESLPQGGQRCYSNTVASLVSAEARCQGVPLEWADAAAVGIAGPGNLRARKLAAECDLFDDRVRHASTPQGEADLTACECEPLSARRTPTPEVPSLTPVGDAHSPVELRWPTPARHWWPYFAVAGLFWAVPGGLLLVGYLALPDHVTSSQCGGSGFGCAVTPKDGTVVLAIYVYPLFVVAGWLIMAVIAMGRALRHRSRWLIETSPRGGASLATRRPVDAAGRGRTIRRGRCEERRSMKA
jgi:hypothetical protein